MPVVHKHLNSLKRYKGVFGLSDVSIPLYTTLYYRFSESSCASSFATASPTSLVLALPPISPVRTPLSIVLRTASSTTFASAGRFKEYCKSMAMERIAATGLTMPFPEISGAEPKQSNQHLYNNSQTGKPTVNWLIDPIDLTLPIGNPAQTRTWQQSQASRNDTGLIADNISKQVTRHHDPI